ncbi:MAG: LON peptidase substrate-binding domain-containing protein [Acidimicrobiia bacterium]|nr:LON peptidase substrate-binding domain-containing protein [Acidimicrobiia bacterium]
MFPLSHPLLPHVALPLHVFEERFRVMVRRCLDGDRRFGVVLIARGSEVGGGDTRYSVGTLARLTEAAELADGRWVLVAAGEQRLRVTRWLHDDPHPRADVEVLEDPAARAGSTERDALQTVMHRISALQTELGDPVPPAGIEIAADPVAASYQAASLAPLGPLDLQQLLEIDDPDDRIAAVRAALAEAEDLLRLRLQR